MIKGASLQLYKRIKKNYNSEEKNSGKKYDSKNTFEAFGYFDNIKIRSYSSVFDAANGGHINDIQYIYDHKNPKDLQEIYVYYDEDDVECEKILGLGSEENDIDQLPLIVITQVKLLRKEVSIKEADEFNKLCITSIEAIISKYLEIEEANGSMRSNVKTEFATMKTIGHSDLVIVFRCNSYSHVIGALQAIRSSSETMIKHTYSVTGISENRMYWKNWVADEQLCSISFRYGVEPQVNYIQLKEKIEGLVQKHHKQYQIDIMTFFGRYDVEIYLKELGSDFCPGLFIEALNQAYELDDQITIVKENLRYVNTKWKYKGEILTVNDQEGQESEEESSNFIGGKNEDDDGRIAKFLNEIVFPKKYNVALFRLFDLYNRVIETESAGVFSKELRRVFETYLNLLCDQDLKQSKPDMSNVCFDHLNDERVVDSINTLSNAMLNRIQSSRFIYEAPVYNLLFNGSVTKLYMAYHYILIMFEGYIGKLTKEYSQSVGSANGFEKVTFAMSQHLDNSVKTKVLLNKTEYSRKNKLAFVVFDTCTFLNPIQGIQFLIHEIGHHIPNYKYIERNAATLSVFVEKCSKIIANRLLGENLSDEYNHRLDCSKGECIEDKFLFDMFTYDYHGGVMTVNKERFRERISIMSEEERLGGFVDKGKDLFEAHGAIEVISNYLSEDIVQPILEKMLEVYMAQVIGDKQEQLIDYERFMSYTTQGMEALCDEFNKKPDEVYNKLCMNSEILDEKIRAGIKKIHLVISGLKDKDGNDYSFWEKFDDLLEYSVTELARIHVFGRGSGSLELAKGVVKVMVENDGEILANVLHETWTLVEECSSDYYMMNLLDMSIDDYSCLSSYYEEHNLVASDREYKDLAKQRIRVLQNTILGNQAESSQNSCNLAALYEMLRCKVVQQLKRFEHVNEKERLENKQYRMLKAIDSFIESEKDSYANQSVKALELYLTEGISEVVKRIDELAIVDLGSTFKQLKAGEGLSSEIGFIETMWMKIEDLYKYDEGAKDE